MRNNHVATVTKKIGRRRTPSNMIRPNVEFALKAMFDENVLWTRREIAAKAKISTQTLYSKALDLVEEAEKRWAGTSQQSSKLDRRKEKSELNNEIKILNQRIDEMTEVMQEMFKAVHAYAPNALHHIANVLERHHADIHARQK